VFDFAVDPLSPTRRETITPIEDGAKVGAAPDASAADGVPQLFPAGPERYLDFACGTGRITQL